MSGGGRRRAAGGGERWRIRRQESGMLHSAAPQRTRVRIPLMPITESSDLGVATFQIPLSANRLLAAKTGKWKVATPMTYETPMTRCVT